MPDFDFSQNHFALFDQPPQFRLNTAALDDRFRALQSIYHPDRSASLPQDQQRRSLQIATRLNEAYQILKQPLARARYLLALHGVDTQEETNTAMPLDFLMAQMEWRERIADAKDSQSVDALEALASELRLDIAALESNLAALMDDQHDDAQAAVAVRKLKFFEKLDADIGVAIDGLLA